MSEGEDGEKRRRVSGGQVAVFFLGVVVVYLLSPGPVALVQQWTVGWNNEWMYRYVWKGVYEPIQWLVDEYSVVEAFYDLYLGLLGVEA